jgi:hypothetical protein
LLIYFGDIFRVASKSEEERQTLLEQLATAKFNLFLIDPVPGGSYLGFRGLAWSDPRFYVTLPPRTNTELIIQRDERTCAFVPLVPPGVNPQSMPGNHGTAAGNLFTQRHESIGGEEGIKASSYVHELTIYKLLNFIETHTGLFKNVSADFKLEHNDLDDKTTNFLKFKKLKRMRALLELYDKIASKNDYFRSLSKHSYRGLFSESTASGERYVHHAGHNFTGLDAIVPDLNGVFVNSEHAFLFLLLELGFDDKAVNEVEAGANLTSTLSLPIMNLIQGYVGNDRKTKALLDNEERRKHAFNALSLLVDNVSQCYLRNHLTDTEKEALRGNIRALYKELHDTKLDHQEDKASVELIETLEDVLFKGVKDTAETHFKSLVEQSKKLIDQLDLIILQDDDIPERFKTFIKDLKKIENRTRILDEIIRRWEENQDDYTIQTIKGIFNTYRDKLQERSEDDYKSINKCAKEYQLELVLDLDQDAPSGIQFLSNLERLYKNITELIAAKAYVKELTGTLKHQIDETTLKLHRDSLLICAGKFLKHKEYDLRTTPEGLNDGFFAGVKPYAILLGAKDPDLQDKNIEIQDKNIEIQDKDKEIKRLRAPKEASCKKLIENQLIPLTEKYLSDLVNTEKVLVNTEKVLVNTEKVLVNTKKVLVNTKKVQLVTGLLQDLKDSKSKSTIDVVKNFAKK